jgi:hypothetical protein
MLLHWFHPNRAKPKVAKRSATSRIYQKHHHSQKKSAETGIFDLAGNSAIALLCTSYFHLLCSCSKKAAPSGVSVQLFGLLADTTS